MPSDPRAVKEWLELAAEDLRAVAQVAQLDCDNALLPGFRSVLRQKF